MKRRGFRWWHRVFCVFGHSPFYRRQHFHPYGFLDAFETACLRCGERLDAWNMHLFPDNNRTADEKK